MKKTTLTALLMATAMTVGAQTFTVYSSTEGHEWTRSKTKMQTRPAQKPGLNADDGERGTEFGRWGTCFNELGWDALNMLPENDRQTIMAMAFAPKGDLRLTMGRIPMNANDYARSWYSCDEVAGDFRLKYFNIDRDRQTLIPYIRMAQKQNPNISASDTSHGSSPKAQRS